MGYQSKGLVPTVSKKSSKKFLRRDDRTEMQKSLDAWASWKKGCKPGKIIQRELGIEPNTLYKIWAISKGKLNKKA